MAAHGFHFSQRPSSRKIYDQRPAVTTESRFASSSDFLFCKAKSFRIYSSDTNIPGENIPSLKLNDNNDTYFELSPTRRVTVGEWQGKVRIDVREYYERDGKMLPGKKGLSLPLKEYEIMKNFIQDGTLDDIIQEKESEIE